MIVVADTTPLNYLIQLGYADVLRELYGRVLVPPAVLTEIQHMEAPARVQAWAATPPSWLEQISVAELDTSLADEVGMGERQAISLALELHADVLLIDAGWTPGSRRASPLRNRHPGCLASGILAGLLRLSQCGKAAAPVRFLGFSIH